MTIAHAEISELITLFNETRVVSFQPGLTAPDCGLESPVQRLAFSAWLSENTAEEAAGGHPIASVDMGEETAGNIYARAGGSEEIVTIPPDLGLAVRRIFEREVQAAP